MIPQGNYVAKAVNWDFGVSDKGTEYIAVEFMITEGEHAGQRRTWRGFFTDKTAERTIQSLRYCGWAGDNLMQIDDLGKNLVQVVINHESYDGKTFDRISFVNRLGGLAIKNKMSDDERQAFAARMRGLALKVPKSLAEGTPAGEAPQAPAESSGGEPDNFNEEPDPFGEDQIPF